MSLNGGDIFPFEDTSELLLTNFSDVALYYLMIDAANALMSEHGDYYDFIGYWLNFAPHHEIGAAFNLSFENDVTGIGADLYQTRGESGLGGDNIEGMVMMWNINSPNWQAGDGPGADYARLVLCHVFEHRFGVFLPALLDGRQMQGGCGYALHWNTKIDGQGSSMDISEWVGSGPASLVTSFGFNADIPGGAYSYTDLYLMGYVTAAEMDAGNSELRFMNSWNCTFPSYSGPISQFSSADIIAAAGPRTPDSSSEDKDYRTGWVMIHRPGDAPDPVELDKAIGILEQNVLDWNASTLGRGTMDHSLVNGPTTAPATGANLARDVRLEVASPNPLATAAVMRYSLPRAMPVTVSVHDVAGRRVGTLFDDLGSAGWQSVRWEGRDDSGSLVPNGIYFVRLTTAEGTQAAKVQVLK